MKSPEVSVIMPVYNREKYVSGAIQSIIDQTFIDFEFIVIDDGSIDSTFEILKSFSDKRIRLIRNSENNGNYTARNKGIEVAKGKYMCVMDSDDIALPHRIQKQYDFMEQNKQIGLCGSHVQIIDSDEIITAPEDYDEIKVWSMSNIMFRHPTVFIRSEFLKKYGLKYNDSYRYAGDYDFLVKAAHLFPVTNIQEVLLKYRKHPDQISTAHIREQFEIVNKVILKQLNLFNRDATSKEKQLHLALMNRFPIKDKSEFEQLHKWANYLLEINYQTNNYDATHLANFLKSLLKYIIKQYKIAQKEKSLFKNEIHKINEILNPELPLLYQKEWTVLPDFTLNLLNIITETKPSVVVECGSGLSTLILGYLIKKGMIDRCLSLEHDKQFYDSTRNGLRKHGLDEYVDLIYAPLKSITIHNKKWLWYDIVKVKATIDSIDLLIIDGPPGHFQKFSRYPAIPLLRKFFNKNTAIVLDDSSRPDENEIINMWVKEKPEFHVIRINTVKGMSMLKQK